MEKNQTLTVEHLIVGNKDGKHLDLSPSQIQLWTSAGRIAAVLNVTDARPELTLYDHHQKERLKIFLNYDGTPHLDLSDANGQARTQIEIDEDGQPRLTLSNALGVDRLEVALDEDDAPALVFFDRARKRRFELSLDYQNTPGCWTYDEDGKHSSWGPRPTHKE